MHTLYAYNIALLYQRGATDPLLGMFFKCSWMSASTSYSQTCFQS